MIGGLVELIGLVTVATGGSLTPDQILSLPVAQAYQLRTLGLIKQNVKMKPAGGSTLRTQVEEILGDQLEEWLAECE